MFAFDPRAADLHSSTWARASLAGDAVEYNVPAMASPVVPLLLALAEPGGLLCPAWALALVGRFVRAEHATIALMGLRVALSVRPPEADAAWTPELPTLLSTVIPALANGSLYPEGGAAAAEEVAVAELLPPFLAAVLAAAVAGQRAALVAHLLDCVCTSLAHPPGVMAFVQVRDSAKSPGQKKKQKQKKTKTKTKNKKK